MEVHEMSSESLYVGTIGEFDFWFFEVVSPLFLYPIHDIVLIYPAEHFSIFPLESEIKYLSLKGFLDFVGIQQSLSSLILSAFFLECDLPESIGRDFASEFFWYEKISRLRESDFHDVSLSTEVSDMCEEFDGDFLGHRKL